ncbi:MAG: DUF927 domain-containing protein [Roseburia sp.]
MKQLKDYDKNSILEESVFEEIFEEEDIIKRSYIIADLSIRAKELNVKSQFDMILKSYEKVIREEEKKEKVKSFNSVTGRVTEFNVPIEARYQNMNCGSWVANENGIVTYNVMGMELRASRQPILPVERLENIETGEEQIVLAFKRNYRWKEITVVKDVVASASKIVALAKYGLSVTSENAKYLVKYLNDVEALNNDDIETKQSSSKLGWHGSEFIPYEGDIIFDGDTRFKSIFEAIHEKGSEDVWLDHAKQIRKTGRIEAKFLLAASFASVLVKPLGALPFFVDLWGETEGGKSVSLMLACSVWANPDESQYIGDFKTTDVALEAKADMLNHLPMMLDDTSKTSARIRDNFEGIVYDLCSGKGKSRSNKELGINRENRWKNCILTNGERPLAGYVNQGGAINRILEVECKDHVFADPQTTAALLKQNYGFAGKRFIEIVKEIGFDSIKEIYRDFSSQLFDTDKMQKQSMSLAVVLTADKIATDYIFKDGCYISFDEAKETLIDRNSLSDNERCYRYLLDKIAMNQTRFDMQTGIEKWGIIENGYAVFYNQAFDDLCKSGGFSRKSFLSWADRKELLQTQAGQLTKVKKINGTSSRCVWLKLDNGIEVDKDGFLQISEDEQEKLPFD